VSHVHDTAQMGHPHVPKCFSM